MMYGVLCSEIYDECFIIFIITSVFKD